MSVLQKRDKDHILRLGYILEDIIQGNVLGHTSHDPYQLFTCVLSSSNTRICYVILFTYVEKLNYTLHVDKNW